MKKSTYLILLLVSLTLSGHAQVTLNAESGNRAIEQGNCWAFGATSYINTTPISGSWSVRSNQLTNPSLTACWLKTPWIKPASGNITMKARLDVANGTTRAIAFSYVPFDPNAASASKEGTMTTFFTYTFTAPLTTAVQSISVPVPEVIAGTGQPFKILVSFVGTGGNSRMYADDLVFPGEYNSDPANGCLPPVTIKDTDKDGVEDASDEYPSDPYRAYNSYYPSLTQTATLAFEDLWPAGGDNDFNDMVVDYRLLTVTNAANQVVEVFARFSLRASGASFHNGFGFQLDGIEPGKVIRVDGNSTGYTSIYSYAANGLESNQKYATCMVFEDFYKLMKWPGSGNGINTQSLSPFVPYYALEVKLTFIQDGKPASGGTVLNSQLTPNLFNFFIVTETWTGETIGDVRITKPDRGKEIHLPNRIPTSLVNTGLFGTADDDSDPASGKYYKTRNNHPWGIEIVQGFDYPEEKAPVYDAYTYFTEWAASAGTKYTDWFAPKAENRKGDKIYRGK